MVTPSTRSRRKYELVKEGLVAGIASGRFAAKERLPTVQALAEQYDVSVAPVVQAITSLCNDGLITKIAGQQGVFVADRPETPDVLDVSTRRQRTALLFGGLAHHRRHGGRMLDTLLVAGRETA